MARNGTAGGRRAPRLVSVARIAIAAACIGAFLQWASDGPVTLGGTQGPNNGWLVALVALFAIGWTRSFARGSWVSVVALLGAAVVMAWTGLENWIDNRHALTATASYGLVLVVAASCALAASTIVQARQLRRSPGTTTAETMSP